MRLSVVIPTLAARPEELARALASVHAQRLAPDEVLVVCDHNPTKLAQLRSQIGSAARVEGGLGQRGVSAARNLGARHASGTFVAFLDDDDAWKPTYLAHALRDGDNFDLALTAFEKHQPHQTTPEKIPPTRLSVDPFLVRNPGIRGSNILVRRSLLLDMGGFDETLMAFNDMDFGLRAAQRPDLRYRQIPQHLVEFYSHTGARLTTKGSTTIAQGALQFFLKHGSLMSPQQQLDFWDRAHQIWGLTPPKDLRLPAHRCA
jgi:glycosyltransferase involved in cell wall biosynthesis